MRRRTDIRGFTLIEMIASLAIVGIFLTLLAFHLVALSNIWLHGVDDDFFDQHVDGVRMFLSNAFDEAEARMQTGNNRNRPAAESLPVRWAKPPGWFDLDPPLLHFRQEQAPALFVREGAHLPRIRAYLHFEERQGLGILWYSEMEVEEPERVEDLFLTIISPFIEKIEYAYFDADDERWEVTERPKTAEDDEYILPHYIKLHFAHEGETRERLVYIPQRNTDIPLF